MNNIEEGKLRFVCPECGGTGLEHEEAQRLWKSKSIEDLTYVEFDLLFRGKAFSGEFRYLRDAKLKTGDIITILKRRGMWVPCKRCKGKGVIK